MIEGSIDRTKLKWIDRPGFRMRDKLEGWDHLTATFGGRAGPNLGIDNLIHEVSHAIICSMDNQLPRLKKRGYGLHIKSGQTILGKWYEEPTTNQASLLECRVFAVQKIILQDLGIVDGDGKYIRGTKPFSFSHEDFYQEGAAILEYMPDWFFKDDYVARIKEFEVGMSLGDIKLHWNQVCDFILGESWEEK